MSERIKMGVSTAGAAATAMFFDLKADAASGIAGAIESVVGFGNPSVMPNCIAQPHPIDAE